jgi:hypothetical protein
MAKRFLILFAAALCIPAVPAFAALTTFYTATSPIPSTLTDWTNTLSFQKFDPSLGTLTGVQLYLSGSADTTLSVTNESQSISSVNVSVNTQITVQDAGSNLISPAIDLIIPTFSYTVNSGDTLSSGMQTKSDSSLNQYTDAAVILEFTGTDFISLNAATLTETLLSYAGGNSDVDQITHAQLTGSVTYIYEQKNIPEPATIMLMSLGMAALRRKKRLAAN